MKKSNILLAVLAVMAAASVAKAEMTDINFDGKLKPQSLHDIFANSHQLVPAPMPVPVETKLNSLGSACALVCVGQKLTNNCQCEPFVPGIEDYDSILTYTWWPYMVGEASILQTASNNEISRKSLQPVRSYDQAAARELAGYYMAQGKIKAVVAEYFTANGNHEAAASLADKRIRVAAANGVVFINRSGSQEQIADSRLAAKVEAIVHPNGQEKILPFIAGATFVAGCMTNDDCWGAVGDGVSSASEAASQIYYTWLNPGPAPEMTW